MESQDRQIEIVAKRDAVYRTIDMFEVARRKVYNHCRIPVPVEDNLDMASTTRSMGKVCPRLITPCHECSRGYATMGKDAYLEWFSKLPFQCDHGIEVTGMAIELDLDVVKEWPPVFMPAVL